MGDAFLIMNLWKNYKNILFDTIPDMVKNYEWANWEGKDTHLVANLYTQEHLIKSREVEIWSETSCIYNNILYPKTGSNLPCFGMDLMAFNKNRVIIVFDFQHPAEHYLLTVPGLPIAEKEYRFFEMGNHFSQNIFVRYCKMDEVDEHLDMFQKYLNVYYDMLYEIKPTEYSISDYKDFDAYMTRLDPVGGYLTGKFGKEKAESLVNDFLFCYK